MVLRKLIVLLACAVPVGAADMGLTTAGAPAAPADAAHAHRDPFIPLSASQRKEIIREFRALLSMGTRSVPASQWSAREFADCRNRNSGDETFCRACEVQMGESRAEYYFYNTSDSECRLQNVEVTIDSTDSMLLRELKPEARNYAGARDGEFYVNEDDRSGVSTLRFVWNRH